VKPNFSKGRFEPNHRKNYAAVQSIKFTVLATHACVLRQRHISMLVFVSPMLVQWRAGGQTGRRPQASKAGGIQRVKSQNLKCC